MSLSVCREKFVVKTELNNMKICRHEKPTDPDDPLSNQNIRDRFYGVNDPVAEKLMTRYKEIPTLETPEDKTVTTLYLGNVVDIDEQALRLVCFFVSLFHCDDVSCSSRDHFYQYGEIRSIAVVPKQSCAFVQFTQRDAAERAAKECFNKLVIDGKRLTVKWGKPPAAQASSGRASDLVSGYETSYEPVPGLPTGKQKKTIFTFIRCETFFSLVVPLPSNELKADFFGLSSTASSVNATTFLPPPPPMPPADLGDYTSSLSYGHISSGMPPPLSSLRSTVHYPSQDPSRVGSTATHGKPNE